MDIKQMLVTMGMLGLFVFAFMSFIITTQNDNGVAIPITNNSIIGSTYSSLETNASATRSQSVNASENFGAITPSQQFGELEVTSIISPTNTAKTIIWGFWTILIQLPMNVLGVNDMVAGLISALLLIFIIIGVWAVWKGAVN